MLKIVAITAGVSSPSSSRMLADMVVSKMGEKSSVETTEHFIELKDHAVDIMHAMTNGFVSPKLSHAIGQVEDADVLVVVTPVFTASMSGLFKSFFDILDNKIMAGKIVIMGATGGSSRHSLVLDYAMRPMFAYLKADTVATSIFAATEDWGGSSGIEERVTQAVQEALSKVATRRPSEPSIGANIYFGTNGSKDDKPISKHDHTSAMTSLPFEELLSNIAGNKVPFRG